jgi:heptosyltransferase-2
VDQVIDRILVIRLSSLGDILLATPVIRALRMKYPGALIDAVVKNPYADTLRCNPHINKLFLFDKKSASGLHSELIGRDYSLIIDLQNNRRSRALVKNAGCEIRRFRKLTFKKLMLVRFKLNLFVQIKTITERYAASAGVELDGGGLDLFIDENVEAVNFGDKNYIGLCPGSRHFTKRWPSGYFIELGRNLIERGFGVVLFGGRDDREICGSISSLITGSVNLQSDDRLYQTAADMKKCRLVITNDSGLMHVAAASGVPVMTIFGSSVREFGFQPYGVKNFILENKSLSCRPCSHIGKPECPKKHFKCMKDLTPQSVLDNLEKFTFTL